MTNQVELLSQAEYEQLVLCLLANDSMPYLGIFEETVGLEKCGRWRNPENQYNLDKALAALVKAGTLETNDHWYRLGEKARRSFVVVANKAGSVTACAVSREVGGK
jgi:hypothetical protein